MTDDRKLEFADWLLVRDTVANVAMVGKSDAEKLMAQGFIDVDAVLASTGRDVPDHDTVAVEDLVGRRATWIENGRHGTITGWNLAEGQPVMVVFQASGSKASRTIPLDWLRLDADEVTP